MFSQIVEGALEIKRWKNILIFMEYIVSMAYIIYNCILNKRKLNYFLSVFIEPQQAPAAICQHLQQVPV